MNEPRATTKVSVYDTPEVIFAQLSRVFTEQTSGAHRWVNFYTEDRVELTFFGTDVPVITPGDDPA